MTISWPPVEVAGAAGAGAFAAAGAFAGAAWSLVAGADKSVGASAGAAGAGAGLGAAIWSCAKAGVAIAMPAITVLARSVPLMLLLYILFPFSKRTAESRLPQKQP